MTRVELELILMPDKILVGVDASWRRSGALDWALSEAELRRLPMRAVHVVDEPPRYDDVAPIRADGQVIRPARIRKPDSRLADELTEYLAGIGTTLDVAADILVGAPDERLAGLSAAADLTLVGRRGFGGFTRLLIGSTSESVAVHADGPVVVVPNGWQRAENAGAPIVVGVDGHDQNDVALEFAFEMAGMHHVPLWMVHAWDVPAPYSWDVDAVTGMRDQWEQAARERLEAVAEQWRRKYPDADVRQEVRQSHAVVALLDAAESTGAQLIVVGGRRHRLPGLMLGSVARGVLQHATVPIAVVHERRTAQSALDV